MLTLYAGGRRVLTLGGSWLFPAFFLSYLLENRVLAEIATLDRSELSVYDSVVGQGALFIYAHLGIGELHAGLASELAAGQARRYGLTLRSEKWVAAIGCQTEELLGEHTSLEEGTALLWGRLKASFWEEPGRFVQFLAADTESTADQLRGLLASPLYRMEA